MVYFSLLKVFNTFSELRTLIEIFLRVFSSLKHFPNIFWLWKKLSSQQCVKLWGGNLSMVFCSSKMLLKFSNNELKTKKMNKMNKIQRSKTLLIKKSFEMTAIHKVISKTCDYTFFNFWKICNLLTQLNGPTRLFGRLEYMVE